MTLVVDSSLVFAGLAERGTLGSWAGGVLASDDLAAPHIMPVETAHVLRRAVLTSRLAGDAASTAHRDLLDLDVALVAYATIAHRVWELRSNVTAYDACYVALAEMLGAPLATLDRRLARASGTLCEFLTPPAALQPD